MSRKTRPMGTFKAIGATFQCRSCCQRLPEARMSVRDMLCIPCLEAPRHDDRKFTDPKYRGTFKP